MISIPLAIFILLIVTNSFTVTILILIVYLISTIHDKPKKNIKCPEKIENE